MLLICIAKSTFPTANTYKVPLSKKISDMGYQSHTQNVRSVILNKQPHCACNWSLAGEMFKIESAYWLLDSNEWRGSILIQWGFCMWHRFRAYFKSAVFPTVNKFSDQAKTKLVCNKLTLIKDMTCCITTRVSFIMKPICLICLLGLPPDFKVMVVALVCA